MRLLHRARLAAVGSLALATALTACSPRDGEAAAGGTAAKPAAFRPLAPGDAAPRYSAATTGGERVTVGDPGPVTLVNVWATWCTTCKEEFADLEAVHREFAPKGLRVVAVSVDHGSIAKVASFATKLGGTFTIAHDPESRIVSDWRLVGVPETFLLDASGAVVWKQQGALPHGAAELRRAIGEALGRTQLRASFVGSTRKVPGESDPRSPPRGTLDSEP